MHRTTLARTQRRTVAHRATRTTLLRTRTLENWLAWNWTSALRTHAWRLCTGRRSWRSDRRRIHRARSRLRNNQPTNRLSWYRTARLRSSALHRRTLYRRGRRRRRRRSCRRRTRCRSAGLGWLRLFHRSCWFCSLRRWRRSRHNNARRLARLRRNETRSRGRLLRGNCFCRLDRSCGGLRLLDRLLCRGSSWSCFYHWLRRRGRRCHRLLHRRSWRRVCHRWLHRFSRLCRGTRGRRRCIGLLMNCF